MKPTDKQRHQGQDHGDVEAGEGRRIDHGPGGEQGSTGGHHQTWLPSQCSVMVLSITRRSTSFLPTKGSRAPAHIETVGDGKPDQQHADHTHQTRRNSS
ncbi:hypothetical protein ACLK2G_03940 [Escherichia coli]